MGGSEDSPTRGQPYLVTLKRVLPTGQVHIEYLTEQGERRAVLLEDYEHTDEVVHGVGMALAEGRRIIKGQPVTPSS